MTGREPLRKARDYPWETWAIFLHPAQRDLVERNDNGSARVASSAGTGKTVVAFRRAAFLARQHANAQIAVMTFSGTLAWLLENKTAITAGQSTSTVAFRHLNHRRRGPHHRMRHPAPRLG